VEDREWEFENWSNIPSKIRNWNSKLGSIFREGYGMGIRNLVKYSVEEKEWEFETWFSIP
jgi:hypothetical protein